MATFNLIRNSRVFFTTNVDVNSGVVAGTGHLITNTTEIQVLDGFSFSQATNAETIQISEAGSSPVRGQRAFNTSLNNVEFSFSTYVRPYLSTTIKAEEHVLWNALLSDKAIGSGVAVSAVTGITYANATGIITFAGTAITGTLPTVGTVYIASGVGGTGAIRANVAMRILTSAVGGITAQVLSPYGGAATLTGTSVTFSECAVVENPAVATNEEVGNVPYTLISTGTSNKNQLQKFGMIIKVDGVTYVIDDCAMDQASIDFSLDGIATIAWTGKGRVLREVAAVFSTAADPVVTGAVTGTYKGKNTTAKYITNKLSTVSIKSNIGGTGGSTYVLALTGGNITIANNITYVVPANLGVVNEPVGYFTGTRSITGNVTAYLRTGALNTAGLLSTMLTNAKAGEVEPKYNLDIAIGGSTAATRVEASVFGALLQIPTVDAQAVMSTTINFTAQGTEGVAGATASYDLENSNDLRLRYLSAA